MSQTVPLHPKIYHITHVDRLASIVADGYLWSDAQIMQRNPTGTTIGMRHIKERRMASELQSHPGLHVGECVPFYFCPRSVMLYVLSQGNHREISFRGGQDPIVHMEADLHRTVTWANQQNLRWAFTLSNAGSGYFEDRSALANLKDIDWAAVQARDWSTCKEQKQAEFLLEASFPLHLVERIGVHSDRIMNRVQQSLVACAHQPAVEILPEWYY
ncbi:DUF4433 domain-containing protein [Myxococcota bacterium]|nr:DUF4433 domain-containing protein [Myxococcota bacterium]